jgi:hypothetical protein
MSLEVSCDICHEGNEAKKGFAFLCKAGTTRLSMKYPMLKLLKYPFTLEFMMRITP